MLWFSFGHVSKISQAKGSIVNNDAMASLNLMQNLYGKMFHPQAEFQITWISIKMTQFDL